MYYFAELLSEKLLENKMIHKSEQEYYCYAIQIYIERIIGFSILFLLSLLFHLFLETVFFISFFSCLRKNAGGFHANSFLGCLLCSIIVYMLYVNVIYPILMKNNMINIILLVFSITVILFIGAVNHPNMHWNSTEYCKCKRNTRIVVLLEATCIFILYNLGISNSYFFFMCFGIILNALMLILGKIIKQEVNLYEES